MSSWTLSHVASYFGNIVSKDFKSDVAGYRRCCNAFKSWSPEKMKKQAKLAHHDLSTHYHYKAPQQDYLRRRNRAELLCLEHIIDHGTFPDITQYEEKFFRPLYEAEKDRKAYPRNTLCLMFDCPKDNPAREMILAAIQTPDDTPFLPSDSEVIGLIKKRYGTHEENPDMKQIFRKGRLLWPVYWNDETEWPMRGKTQNTKATVMELYDTRLGCHPLQGEERPFTDYSEDEVLLVFAPLTLEDDTRWWDDIKGMVLKVLPLDHNIILPPVPESKVWIPWLEARYGPPRNDQVCNTFYRFSEPPSEYDFCRQVMWVRGGQPR